MCQCTGSALSKSPELLVNTDSRHGHVDMAVRPVTCKPYQCKANIESFQVILKSHYFNFKPGECIYDIKFQQISFYQSTWYPKRPRLVKKEKVKLVQFTVYMHACSLC